MSFSHNQGAAHGSSSSSNSGVGRHIVPQVSLVSQLVAMGFDQEKCERVVANNLDFTLEELVAQMINIPSPGQDDGQDDGQARNTGGRGAPLSAAASDAKRRKKLNRRLSKLGGPALSMDEPASSTVLVLQSINAMKTSWIRLANQDPVDTLEVLLRDARESASSHSIPADDGAENDDASEAEGDVADEHDVDQLVSLVGCSRDRAMAVLMSTQGDANEAAAVLLGEKDGD